MHAQGWFFARFCYVQQQHQHTLPVQILIWSSAVRSPLCTNDTSLGRHGLSTSPSSGAHGNSLSGRVGAPW